MSRRERLTLVFHNGDVQGSFNEFIVEPTATEAAPAKCHLEHINRFISGKGLALGITTTEVQRLLGAPHQRIGPDGGDVTYQYRIDNFADSDFLKFYGLPVYFGEYRFRQGRLTYLHVGFEYP
ncbi:MAG: hypothetical protein AABY83_14500 [Pseudomonadota bacterium]